MRIESSKSEIRSSKQIRMLQCQKPRGSGSGSASVEYCCLGHSSLFRISDFGFRILIWLAVVLNSPRLFAFSKNQVVERAKMPALRPPLNLMPPSFWEQHGGPVIAGTVVALGAVVLAIWLLRRARPVVEMPADVAARQALEALRGRAEDERVVAEVSRNLRLYVRAAFLQQSDELTTEELLSALGHRTSIPSDPTLLLSSLLRECASRRFAPIPPPAPPALVPRALELVARFESVRKPAAILSPGSS
jgi:hypothetical protein